MLVHESNVEKGGAPLRDTQAECIAHGGASVHARVFADGQQIIPWVRILDFQLVSLKMICAAILRHLPIGTRQPQLLAPGLYTSRDLKPMHFPSEVRLVYAARNAGARELAVELQQEALASAAIEERSSVRKNSFGNRFSLDSSWIARASTLRRPGQRGGLASAVTYEVIGSEHGQELLNLKIASKRSRRESNMHCRRTSDLWHSHFLRSQST